MSATNQIQNKPTSAYNFSLIGGVLGTIISLALIGFGADLLYLYNTSPYFNAPHPVGQPDVRVFRNGADYSIFWIFLVIGFWCLISAIIILYSAKKLMANPTEHSKWGNTIIIFSIFGLGTIFAIIGGILAVSFKPDSVTKNNQPITKICLQCGTVVNNSKYCPECGKEVVHKEAVQKANYSIHEVTANEEFQNTRDIRTGDVFKETENKTPKPTNVRQHKPVKKKYAILAVAITAVVIASIFFIVQPSALFEPNHNQNIEGYTSSSELQIQNASLVLQNGKVFCSVQVNYNPSPHSPAQCTIYITVGYSNGVDCYKFIVSRGISSYDVPLNTGTESTTINGVGIENNLGVISHWTPTT